MEMGANGMHGTRLSQCAGPAPRARPDKHGPLGVPPHQLMEGEVCSLKSFGGEMVFGLWQGSRIFSSNVCILKMVRTLWRS